MEEGVCQEWSHGGIQSGVVDLGLGQGSQRPIGYLFFFVQGFVDDSFGHF
jgi:hypothetical protein